MQEIWKEIDGSNGHYEVSNLGNVRCTDTGKILKVSKKRRYLQVDLRYGINKTVLIHRLVAQAFIKNPNKFPIINHKDENKHNNCVNNLEWCTQKYNVNYGEGYKVRYKRIIQYDLHGNALKIWESMDEAAKYYNVKYQNISACCRGKKKLAVNICGHTQR